MEPSTGFEKRDGKLVPRRPRSCSNEETDGGDNACACYILNIAGQNGYKVIIRIHKMMTLNVNLNPQAVGRESGVPFSFLEDILQPKKSKCHQREI